ncbi:MAG: putative NADH-flavin reductase [Ferruginibacter sp.]|nr:putative NADH-flavin reductase [Ferruginibacter sp.]
MKVIIFGATGTVGRQLVKQALYRGHEVKAFGRNVFTDNLPADEKLELVQGALFDEGQVFKAIKGCDAVLSSLGGDSSGSDVTRSLGMKNIVAQMQKASVRRIVAVGGMGSLNAEEELLVMDTPEYPKQFLPVSKEHLKALEFLKTSTLDWTVVCPPDIINAEPTGIFVTAADYPPTPNSNRINSGDLALFMLTELERNEFIHHRVGISN